MRLCDESSRPSLCTACGNAGDETTRFVDLDCEREGPVVLDTNGDLATDRKGAVVTLDDVFVCEGCVRIQAELIGFRPELHSRQMRENEQAKLSREYWMERAKRAETDLERTTERLRRAESELRPVRGPGRPRKVAA